MWVGTDGYSLFFRVMQRPERSHSDCGKLKSPFKFHQTETHEVVPKSMLKWLSAIGIWISGHPQGSPSFFLLRENSASHGVEVNGTFQKGLRAVCLPRELATALRTDEGEGLGKPLPLFPFYGL